MPEELFARMPPIIAASIDAGSGPMPAPVARQQPVQVAAHDAGLAPDPLAVVEHARLPEEGSELDEHVVAHGLAVERRAGGAEGEVTVLLARPAEELADLGDAARTHDRLRDQPVDRGVGRAAQAVDRPRQHAFGREDALEVLDHARVGLAQHRAAHGRGSATGTWKR